MIIVRVTRNSKATTRAQVIEAIRAITGETVEATRFNMTDISLWRVTSNELTKDINDAPVSDSGFDVRVIG